MLNANFKLDGNTPTVSWADPKSTPDHSAAASQVKSSKNYNSLKLSSYLMLLTLGFHYFHYLFCLFLISI